MREVFWLLNTANAPIRRGDSIPLHVERLITNVRRNHSWNVLWRIGGIELGSIVCMYCIHICSSSIDCRRPRVALKVTEVPIVVVSFIYYHSIIKSNIEFVSYLYPSLSAPFSFPHKKT